MKTRKRNKLGKMICFQLQEELSVAEEEMVLW